MCVGVLVSVGVRCERCEAMTPFCLVRLPYYAKAAFPIWRVAAFSGSQRTQTGTTGVSNIIYYFEKLHCKSKFNAVESTEKDIRKTFGEVFCLLQKARIMSK